MLHEYLIWLLCTKVEIEDSLRCVGSHQPVSQGIGIESEIVFKFHIVEISYMLL